MISTHARPLLVLSLLAFAGCGGDDAAQVPPRAPEPAAPAAPSAAAPVAPPAPTQAPVPAQGTAIGAAMPMQQLVQSILELKNAPDRLGLSALSTDGANFQLVMAPETDAARIATLSTALGSVSTTPIAWPPTSPLFAVELLEVRGHSMPLYASPSTRADVVRVLPDGAFFVGLSGTFSTGPSAHAAPTDWLYGQTSSGVAGWLQSAHVGVEEGCVLPKDALAHALSLNLDDPRLATALVGNMHLYRGGQSKHGTFFLTDSFVATLERGNCRHGTVDVRIDTGLSTLEFHHARLTEQGDTFLAIALEPDDGSDNAKWQFFLPGSNESTLELALRSGWQVPSRDREVVHFGVRRGPESQRGYWPFSVQVGREPARFYTSDGTAFTEVTAPEGAAP